MTPGESAGALGIQRQRQIYAEGAEGRSPVVPVAFEDLERAAAQTMDPAAFDFAAGGAGGGETLAANREAFRRWRIVPRFLRDVSRRETHVDLFGTRLPMPVLCAPIGVQDLYHPLAEEASSRAAARLGIPFVLSSVASRSIEQVAEAGGPRWFQLYWSADDHLNASFVGRAERAGYTAIVVTVDTFFLAWRERDMARGFSPFLRGNGMANYLSDPAFRGALATPPEVDLASAIRHFTRVFSDPTLGWDDLARLRRHTRLPLLIKGLQHPLDARRALEVGADGIIVSNHGGRQLDGAIGSLQALPAMVDAVEGRIPVLFDGGVRRGADAFKALALGARAVLVGRPYIFGLAAAGEEGVREVLENFCADLDLTLALSGHRSFDTVDRQVLAPG